MHPVINKNLFFVKQHVGLFKAAVAFDIYDPESNQIVMTCREQNLGFFSKIFRFTDYRQMTPFDIVIQDVDGSQIARVKRGTSFFLSKVTVFDEKNQVIGGFKQKLFTIGGAFDVLDNHDHPLCTLKGKWTGWDFRFMAGEQELAHITKKWAGLGKELFTSADNYIIQINDSVPEDNPIRQLILSAVMCIDLVLKNR